MRSFKIALSLLLMSSAAHAAPTKGGVDPETMRMQVLLDRAGFTPGVIDGRAGWSFSAALKGFQKARGLKETGVLDAETRAALDPNKAFEPVVSLKLLEEDFKGPFVGPLPQGMDAQAKLPSLGYSNAVERLAEKFHTTPATISALNAGAPFEPGKALRLPNVLPKSRSYPEKLSDQWKTTLSDLNIDPAQPTAKRIVVDKSDRTLSVYDDADKLVAQFPATMGSGNDPLPIGNWTIKGAAYNPPFHYNPKLFWDAAKGDEKEKLPSGPNSPVGVVWLDLSKEHYGIHGTPNPEKIGRTESHGCIRLTNWDAARLSLMVGPGTPAVFQP